MRMSLVSKLLAVNVGWIRQGGQHSYLENMRCRQKSILLGDTVSR